MATTSTQPTVYLFIEGSALAFDESGEIVESVEFDESGKPIWDEHVAVADHRGIGGARGYNQLRTALEAAEANAKLVIDGDVVRVPVDRDELARNIEDEQLGEQAARDGIIGRPRLGDTPYPDGNAEGDLQ